MRAAGFLRIPRYPTPSAGVSSGQSQPTWSISHDRRVQQGALQANMHPSNVPETIAIRSACDVCSATAAC